MARLSAVGHGNAKDRPVQASASVWNTASHAHYSEGVA